MWIIPCTITLWVNSSEDKNHEMIIISTFIKRRDITYLSIKQPFECITSSMYSCYIMPSRRNIIKRLYTITIFTCILLKISSSSTLCDKFREFIISFTACRLREVYKFLDNSCCGLCLEIFLIKNLKNNISLC